MYTRNELLALNRHDVTPAGVSGRLFLVTGCGGHYVNDGTPRAYSSMTRSDVRTLELMLQRPVTGLRQRVFTEQ